MKHTTELLQFILFYQLNEVFFFNLQSTGWNLWCKFLLLSFISYSYIMPKYPFQTKDEMLVEY